MYKGFPSEDAPELAPLLGVIRTIGKEQSDLSNQIS
jgi:hypothetical protein